MAPLVPPTLIDEFIGPKTGTGNPTSGSGSADTVVGFGCSVALPLFDTPPTTPIVVAVKRPLPLIDSAEAAEELTTIPPFVTVTEPFPVSLRAELAVGLRTHNTQLAVGTTDGVAVDVLDGVVVAMLDRVAVGVADAVALGVADNIAGALLASVTAESSGASPAGFVWSGDGDD